MTYYTLHYIWNVGTYEQRDIIEEFTSLKELSDHLDFLLNTDTESNVFQSIEMHTE